MLACLELVPPENECPAGAPAPLGKTLDTSRKAVVEQLVEVHIRQGRRTVVFNDRSPYHGS
jgi:hypothetical protein